MTEATETTTARGVRLFKGELHRNRRGCRLRLEGAPLKSRPRGETSRPLRAALLLAQAHKMRRLLDSGQVKSAAELARRLGFTRARVSQLLDLTLLAPDIQEQVLYAANVAGRDAITERDLRVVARHLEWARQREVFRGLTG